MSLITWNDEFDVGDTTINEQHQTLIDQLNKLHDAMSQGLGKVVVNEILEEVVNYTRYHFESEEAKLASIGFPGLAEHKKKHAELLEKTEELNENAKNKSFMLSIQVMDFLNQWITTHILVEDMEYKPFLQKK